MKNSGNDLSKKLEKTLKLHEGPLIGEKRKEVIEEDKSVISKLEVKILNS
jgi:hypothetical protein